MGALAVSFDWSFVADNADELFAGLRRTLLVSGIAIAGAFVIGLVLGAARAHRVPVVSQVAAAYVEVIRNTPILVQIFFLYFGLTQEIGPWPGIRLEAFTVAWLAIMIWGGAFNTENFRAGFEAVHIGQREAALAVGMTPGMTFREIILPQTWRVTLPPIGNYAVQLVKDTSLVAAIAAPEIMFTARNLVVNTFQTTLVYGIAAALYLAICIPLSRAIRRLERRMAIPR